MRADNIEGEIGLASLLDDLSVELQLIAGDLRKEPYVCTEGRFNAVCDAISQTKHAAMTIGLGEPDVTLKLFNQIRASLDLQSQAAMQPAGGDKHNGGG
jgi:hypothetical protein